MAEKIDKPPLEGKQVQIAKNTGLYRSGDFARVTGRFKDFVRVKFNDGEVKSYQLHELEKDY